MAFIRTTGGAPVSHGAGAENTFWSSGQMKVLLRSQSEDLAVPGVHMRSPALHGLPCNLVAAMNFAAQLLPFAWLWWTVAFAYNPTVHVAQASAHLLKPYSPTIRLAWGWWNTALAVLSLLGFANTIGAYFAMLKDFPHLCDADGPTAAALWAGHFTGPAGTWVLYFIVSKLFELGDTLFLAALGKPIIFLHWYHHLTILVYMYLGGLNWHPFMISGVSWNYLVHTVMYAYYASSCFGIRWPKPAAQQITTLQLTQMFANLALLAASFYCCGCNFHISVWPSTVMYTAYAALFMVLFSQKYRKTNTSKQAGSASSKAWQQFVTIDGTDYDVTNFVKQHPGGGVIRSYLGKDATAAFKEFHSNSKRAVKVLHSLPQRPSSPANKLVVTPADAAPAVAAGPKDITPRQGGCCRDPSCTHSSAQGAPPAAELSHLKPRGPAVAPDFTAGPDSSSTDPATTHSDSAILTDFAAWRAGLVDRGLFKPRPVWQLACMLLEPLLFVAAGCWLMRLTGSVACGVVLLALANIRCGWIQHEGGHNSLTGHIKVDKLIQTVTIGLGLHTSGWVWNSMHTKHHVTPNKINHDVDLNTLPLVSFYVGCLEKDRRARTVSRPVLRWWLKLQAFSFLPISTFVLTLFWALVLHPVKALRRDRLGLLMIALSHTLKPLLFVTFGGTTFVKGYLLTALALWVASAYLFGHFALSHTFMPVVDEADDCSWVHYALEHSVDISPGNRLVDWVMGYLNYQVIHHLFPTLPQSSSPIISRELQIKARQWGLTYTTMSYPAAWKAMLGNLHAVGDHYFTELGHATFPAGNAGPDACKAKSS